MGKAIGFEESLSFSFQIFRIGGDYSFRCFDIARFEPGLFKKWGNQSFVHVHKSELVRAQGLVYDKGANKSAPNLPRSCLGNSSTGKIGIN